MPVLAVTFMPIFINKSRPITRKAYLCGSYDWFVSYDDVYDDIQLSSKSPQFSGLNLNRRQHTVTRFRGTTIESRTFSSVSELILLAHTIIFKEVIFFTRINKGTTEPAK